MDWNLILRNNYDWEEDTYNRIKEHLIPIKDNRFLQYQQSKGTKIVCLYGKSQVGKTTLILNMIGLKEECKNEVANVLRGGVSKGNSSTSTAIIYSQNRADDEDCANKYGILSGTFENQNNNEIEFLSPEDMIRRLKVIRDGVEQNQLSTTNVLYIYIPQHYFIENINESISIIDLPGIESRNKEEYDHVNCLMTHYLPISSLCLIVCPAENIQSLETLELPHQIDWKNLPHKFSIAITKSYSEGSVKKYFKESREQRSEDFRTFISKLYRKELDNILGTNNEISVYPIDIGESYECLRNEVTLEEDKLEIQQTRDWYLSSLKAFIIEHKSEQLLSAIKELRNIVEKVDTKQIKELLERKEELEKEKEKKAQKLKTVDNDQKEVEENFKELKQTYDTCEKMLKDINQCILDQSQKIVKQIKELLKKYTENDLFYDKEKELLKDISNIIFEKLTVITEIKQKMAQTDECPFKLSCLNSDLQQQVLDCFCDRYEKKLYTPRRRLFGIIGDRYERINIADAERYVGDLESIINDKTKYYTSKVEEKINDIKKEEEKYKFKAKYWEKKSCDYRNKLKGLRQEIDKVNQQLQDAEKQKQDDKATLDSYLKYAKESYENRSRLIVQEINSDSSPERKIMDIISLGVLTKKIDNLISSSNG